MAIPATARTPTASSWGSLRLVSVEEISDPLPGGSSANTAANPFDQAGADALLTAGLDRSAGLDPGTSLQELPLIVTADGRTGPEGMPAR